VHHLTSNGLALKFIFENLQQKDSYFAGEFFLSEQHTAQRCLENGTFHKEYGVVSTVKNTCKTF
jgi:hypothetical protein